MKNENLTNSTFCQSIKEINENIYEKKQKLFLENENVENIFKII